MSRKTPVSLSRSSAFMRMAIGPSLVSPSVSTLRNVNESDLTEAVRTIKVIF